jgi:selenocysteine lyase/cysteine desulfurase
VAPHLSIVGEGDGRLDEVNLDYAATTPALQAALDALLEALPFYGSVHRGGGERSRRTTEVYEHARASLASFVGADDDFVVVFVRNTTEAINLVAAALPERSRILCTPLEHHANLLPWMTREVSHLPFTDSPDALLAQVEAMLTASARDGGPFDMLAICGASNVTGEVMPVAALAELAREAGTRILVDAAQLAPHRAIDVRELDVDVLALSGHKLYAPFGTGVLVVRRGVLDDALPLLKGGGAVRSVSLDDVVWADLPQRLEAGTPNVLGAVALAGAVDALAAYGLESIEASETALARRLWHGLDSIDGCRVLRTWPHHDDRVAVATFVLDGVEPREVGRRLGVEYGVAVRAGLFCAHPLVSHLLGTPESTLRSALERSRGGEEVQLPGAVRASIGIGVDAADVDRLLEGVAAIADRPRS